jgi:hypothetical protein
MEADMARPSIWETKHIDFVEQLVQQGDLTSQEIATHMARQFRCRVTSRQVNVLLQRMRTPSDVFYRRIPYRRRGASFSG